MTQPRLSFLDGVRGLALVLMVLNHTAHWWLDRSMGWGRYYLVYTTLTLAAPLFLFLVGFCLAVSFEHVGTAAGRSEARAARRYVGRGVRVIGAGLLLNLLVFPRDPLWTGGVLQTIGLSLVVMAPLACVLCNTGWRTGLMALVTAAYAAFALSFTALTRWVPAHPVVSQVLFKDFPPWPWVGLPIVGLVAGAVWLDARRQGRESAYFRGGALMGTAAIAIFVLLRGLGSTGPRFGFMHDFVLNRHWTPGGLTLLWVLGIVALIIAGGYYVMEVKVLRLGWLAILGRAAMMLYFMHQLLVLTLVNQWLGLRFNDWPLYGAMNAALLVVLVGLAHAWLAGKAWVRRSSPWARPPWSLSRLPPGLA